MIGKRLVQKTSLTLAAAVLMSVAGNPGAVAPVPAAYAEEAAAVRTDGKTVTGALKQENYERYLERAGSAERPDREIVVQAESYTRAEGMEARKLDGYEGNGGASVMTDETGRIEWQVDIPESGFYNLSLRYFPVAGKSSSIERELLIDGKRPFYEAANLIFPRTWTNELDRVLRDNRGNELRPRQVEKPVWQELPLRNVEGYYNEPYRFLFTAGKHTITLVSNREPMVIDYLKLYQEEKIPSYADVKQSYEKNGYREAKGTLIKVQAEKATLKSSPTLYPIYDRASPKTEPYNVSKIRINTIGGYNWRMPGDWIEWTVEVPESGLYKIAMRERQNRLRGLFSARKLSIDGKVPFQEAEVIPFRYDADWNMQTIGKGKEPYLFYLDKGTHRLRLEVTLGDVAPLLRQVEASILELNNMYRKILMITGAFPDPYRDYRLEKQIPDMVDTFRRQSELLYGVADTLERVTGERSDQQAILNTMAYQLKDMADRPQTVPKRLDQYKINAGGLGTWILTVREQPLELDYLIVAAPDRKLPKGGSSLWQKAKHEVSAFFASFFNDYNTIGNVSEDGRTVTVWMANGREQAQVMKDMIDDSFTSKTGIGVNLKLVDMNMLLPANLSDAGPDVAMNMFSPAVTNYGMRNAAVDLTEFPDFGEVAARFHESAIEPLRYNGGIYGLPEQQAFSMLFYRKDIFEELGLQVPSTWEELYTIIPELQKRHLEIALPLDQTPGSTIPNWMYGTLLYQNGGAFYEDEGRKSGLGSETAMLTFKRWTEFYTNYKFPVQFDFPNRFRTGEMPLGVADYTFYNYLSVSAPEIKGLWEFVPLPGTPQADGTVRRDTPSGGSAAFIMKKAKDKDAAWEFVKWWTDKETQVRYGREMEGLMGPAARYPTANVEALKELPWPVKDLRSLEEQWQWVRGIPEVPGGYFTGRHLDNAFRKVINEGINPREALNDYVRFIDDEIKLKRQEFNLEP